MKAFAGNWIVSEDEGVCCGRVGLDGVSKMIWLRLRPFMTKVPMLKDLLDAVVAVGSENESNGLN